MFTKVRIIAINGIYRTFQDRMALMFMLLLPIAMAVIFGGAFGDTNEDVSLPQSTIIVINQDNGNGNPDTALGRYYETLLVEDTPDELAELLTGESGQDIEAARQQVEDGDVRAMLIIPEDFTRKVLDAEAQGTVEIYYNPGSEIAVTITAAVINQFTTLINSGQVAQEVLLADMEPAERAMLTAEIVQMVTGELSSPPSGEAQRLIRFYSEESRRLVRLNQMPVEESDDDFNILSYVMPGFAILFMTFAMTSGASNILYEQQLWTFQRIISTPTPRWVYMLGRLLGIFATGIAQMSILLVVTPIISLFVSGNSNVWGDNYIGLILITFAVVFAGTGLGLIFAGVSKDAEQANIYSSPVLIVMSMLGGTFFPVDDVPVISQLRYLTLNHWGFEGYFDLAVNNASIGDIGLNILVLSGMGILFFSIALFSLNRRMDF